MGTIRGTTPLQTFRTDVDISDAEVVYITYKQGSEVILEKTKEELTFGDKTITFRMTQKESLRMRDKKPVEMQIRARFADGNAIACEIIAESVSRVLKDGEI